MEALTKPLIKAADMAHDITHKVCSTCKLSLPIERFGVCAGYKDGRRGQCSKCRSKANMEALRLSPKPRPKANPEQTRRYKLKQKYRMEETDFQALLEKQGGVCAVCGTDKAGGRWGVFHVDHCHQSGLVRGLLCHQCNVTLGRMGDDLSSVMRYVRYLSQMNEQATQLENSKGQ